MFAQFKARAEGVGAEVHRCGGGEELEAFIRTFLQREGVAAAPQRTAVWAPGPLLAESHCERLAREIPGLSFAVSRATAAAAMIGITAMDWALADTGTLVADQTAVDQRLASSLPDIHLALVGSERILADKAALFSRIDPPRSGYLAFITGPSRTADIERVLTIGVHGPKRLVILCIDSREGGGR